ncbi:MAG TPA: glycosyltransferase family 4 protein [Polyangiaceae bacterium]|nr:glycosyltransferase family 4 protein [Polyangiaceae bacterium]
MSSEQTATQRRHRVLVLADSCNPEWPSLPVVGYKAAKALADVADVTVATSVRNRPNIEKVGMGRAKVAYIDNEYVAKNIFKISRWVRGSEGAWTTAMAFSYPSYVAFEYEALRTFASQIESGEFDVIHRITPMSPTLPSFVAAKVKHIPFVLGPLNGGLPWPPEFRNELRKEKEWMAALRGLHQFLPYHKRTFQNSAAILAGFRHTIDRLPLKSEDRVIDFPEVGFDPELFSVGSRQAFQGEATILYAGRLVPYKLPDTVVHAFVENSALHRHRLIVAGDGPMRAELEQIVRAAGLAERVSFLGKVTQAEVGELMRKSDIFAFPSIRELGAGVLIEAMACALACVVVDYGAPGALIDSDRGVVLPLSAKPEVIKNLGAALVKLTSSPSSVLQKGENARDFAFKHYTWAAKAAKTLEVYDWVLGRNPRKPSF